MYVCCLLCCFTVYVEWRHQFYVVRSSSTPQELIHSHHTERTADSVLCVWDYTRQWQQQQMKIAFQLWRPNKFEYTHKERERREKERGLVVWFTSQMPENREPNTRTRNQFHFVLFRRCRRCSTEIMIDFQSAGNWHWFYYYILKLQSTLTNFIIYLFIFTFNAFQFDLYVLLLPIWVSLNHETLLYTYEYVSPSLSMSIWSSDNLLLFLFPYTRIGSGQSLSVWWNNKFTKQWQYTCVRSHTKQFYISHQQIVYPPQQIRLVKISQNQTKQTNKNNELLCVLFNQLHMIQRLFTSYMREPLYMCTHNHSQWVCLCVCVPNMISTSPSIPIYKKKKEANSMVVRINRNANTNICRLKLFFTNSTAWLALI